MANDLSASRDDKIPSSAAETDSGFGFLLKWRRRGDVLEGLVCRDVDGQITAEWLPALAFEPAEHQRGSHG